MLGKVRKVVLARGFGFITPDGEPEKSVFFHASVVDGDAHFDELAEGQAVVFETETTEKGDRATSLTLA